MKAWLRHRLGIGELPPLWRMTTNGRRWTAIREEAIGGGNFAVDDTYPRWTRAGAVRAAWTWERFWRPKVWDGDWHDTK